MNNNIRSGFAKQGLELLKHAVLMVLSALFCLTFFFFALIYNLVDK